MGTLELPAQVQESGFESMKLRLYRSLKTDIITGAFDMGDRLNEAQLAARYGVSKTPVREALALLQRDRLVELVPRAGYLTSRLTLRDVENIFDLRQVLEAASAERAAVAISEEVLKQLDRLDDVYRPDEPGSYRAFLQNNSDFHRLIAEASGNPLLVEALVPLLEHTQRLLILRANIGGDGHEMVGHHQEIVAALRRRDASQARELMVRSIVHSRQAVIQSLIARMSSWHL